MPALVLLNGMPAAGKSTLAAKLVEQRPMALNLDIDGVRHQIGHWLGRPTEAGLAARGLARVMAEQHLAGGFDVVVPQYLGRPGFIVEMEQVAIAAGASFHYLLLDMPLDQTMRTFERRRLEPDESVHGDAATLMDGSGVANPLARYHDMLRQLAVDCPPHGAVAVIEGDVDATLAAVLTALSELGVNWSES